MRRFLLALLWLSLFQQLAAAQVAPAPQVPLATQVQVRGADCALFPAEKFIYDIAGKNSIVGDSVTGRFTPTKQRVDSVENLLPMLLQAMVISPRFRGKERYYKKHLRPLPKNLKRYRRQYFGFYNSRHQPCLYINFFNPDSPYIKAFGFDWLLKTVLITDAGFMLDDSPNLWQVSFNLTTQQLYSFEF
ncbi:MAG TPA: hypothetical protein VFO93_21450 [Hymenobacter sp.]|uniref:hypothetical protein n=1 Tax=Hymenobacter sp. TaxID=1898978 RepID=UPI002D7E4A4F|nr:hypothetical protein [Hymenobacter sp.]HET9506120.1 hypothetical protein [Hymenobacter sp.]